MAWMEYILHVPEFQRLRLDSHVLMVCANDYPERFACRHGFRFTIWQLSSTYRANTVRTDFSCGPSGLRRVFLSGYFGR